MDKDNCYCGSGLIRQAYYDARNIYLCSACDKCWPEKRAKYRPDVLTDPNYWADEDIGDEE